MKKDVNYYRNILLENDLQQWHKKNWPSLYGGVVGGIAGGPVGAVAGSLGGKAAQYIAGKQDTSEPTATTPSLAGGAAGTAVGTAVGGPFGGMVGGYIGSKTSISDLAKGISKLFTGETKKKSKGRMGSVARFVERPSSSAAADYGRRMQYGVGMEEPRSQYDLERIRMADRDIAAAKAEAGGNLGYQSRAQQLAGRVSRGYSGTLGANLEGDEKYDAYAGRLFTPPDAFKKELEKAKMNTATMKAELEAEDQYNRGERPSVTPEEDSDLNIVRGGGNFGNLSSAEITQARMSAANRIMDRIKNQRK